jgi:hypothetical protein
MPGAANKSNIQNLNLRKNRHINNRTSFDSLVVLCMGGEFKIYSSISRPIVISRCLSAQDVAL